MDAQTAGTFATFFLYVAAIVGGAAWLAVGALGSDTLSTAGKVGAVACYLLLAIAIGFAVDNFLDRWLGPEVEFVIGGAGP
jgi:uncharacterized membrane protein YwzB